MNIQHAINIGSAGVAIVACSLSLPLSVDRLSHPAPSLSPSLSPRIVYLPPNAHPSLPPCDHEDGTSTSNGIDVPVCVWDASSRGNGVGKSFIVIAR